MQGKKEYILCSAIWYKDGGPNAHQPVNIPLGIVVCGRRHHNCITTLSALLGEKYNVQLCSREAQGFLTSKNRFVGREEGYRIAMESNQLLLGHYQQEPYLLTSEDLW